jgi:hypothetical protein
VSGTPPLRDRGRTRSRRDRWGGHAETVGVVRAVPRWRKVAAVLSAVGVVYLFSRGPEMIPLAVMLIAVPIMLPLNFATELRWRTDERIRRWARARDWPDVTIPSAYARRWPGPPFDGVSQAVVREVVSGPVESITVTSMTLVLPGERRRRSLRRPRWTAWLRWWGRGSWRTWRHTAHVVVAEAPGPLPEVSLTPHGDDLPGERRAQDLDTESAAFNREWRVRGEDARAVHGLLHPAMIDLLMHPVLRGAHLRTAGGSLLVWWPGPTDVTLLDERVTVVAGLAWRVPQHVIDDRVAALTEQGR